MTYLNRVRRPVADARALAIRYHAYHQAINAEDWNGVILWGGMLTEVLEKLGIDDLTDTDNLAVMVAVARRKVAAAEAIVD